MHISTCYITGMHRYGDEQGVPIMLWGVYRFSKGTELVSWKLQSYQLHRQLTVFSLPPLQVPQWSGQTVHCFRPLRVSRITHIHILVFTAQRSSIPRCQFRYIQPIVPSIIFRLRFTLYCFCHFLCLFQPWGFRMQPRTLGQKGMWW